MIKTGEENWVSLLRVSDLFEKTGRILRLDADKASVEYKDNPPISPPSN
ncbi:MAG: hypothetical protein ACYDH1_03390 [Anaerolineaceae bacterium]